MMQWNVTRHASPDYAPQFGVYAGDETSDFAIVRGADAAERVTLIAAAPDLLDALGDMVVLFSKMNVNHGASDAWRRAVEIIAKAEGR